MTRGIQKSRFYALACLHVCLLARLFACLRLLPSLVVVVVVLVLMLCLEFVVALLVWLFVCLVKEVPLRATRKNEAWSEC